MNTRIAKTILAQTLALAAVAPSLRAGSCCDGAAEPTVAARALPETSIYQSAANWKDQSGRAVTLAQFSGSPVLATMVFTHCAYACPRTVADVKAALEALPPAVRAETRVVMVSFDDVRDTPARLREWADAMGLDDRWTLLHGDAFAVRELSVLLDIAWQKQPDGSFAHANRIVLLDRAGVPVAAVNGLGASPQPLVETALLSFLSHE